LCCADKITHDANILTQHMFDSKRCDPNERPKGFQLIDDGKDNVSESLFAFHLFLDLMITTLVML
jgi:hypothetical protein